MFQARLRVGREAVLVVALAVLLGDCSAASPDPGSGAARSSYESPAPSPARPDTVRTHGSPRLRIDLPTRSGVCRGGRPDAGLPVRPCRDHATGPTASGPVEEPGTVDRLCLLDHDGDRHVLTAHVRGAAGVQGRRGPDLDGSGARAR